MSVSKTKKPRERGFFAEVWRNYRKSFGAMLGLAIIAVMVIITIVGAFVYSYDDITSQVIVERMKEPSEAHWFGTDEFGRDIFARIVYGARFSLSIGFSAVLFSCVIGVVLGSLAGYYGGAVETVIMRLTDIFMSIPSILFGICLVSAFGQGLLILVLAVSISSVPAMVRITRASVMTVCRMEYVEAARAAGANDFVIIFRHVLVNALAPIIVQATLLLGGSIVAIAGLSFIGLGIEAPLPEWGSMLSAARGYIRKKPYMALYPGLAIMIAVMGFNLIGDGIRDSMDPKLKK